MARKRDFLVNVGGEMKTVAPSIITQTYEDGQWVGRTKPIVKGWQKINGAMVEVFDNDPSGPPYTKLTFQAYVGRDSLSEGGSPRVGYHSTRRYAGTVRNDAPLGYLISTTVWQIRSATIGRVAVSTGGGQGSQLNDSLILMFNDRTVNADGTTTIDLGISDITVTFIKSNGEEQVISLDIPEGRISEETGTNPNAPLKFGYLRLSVPNDFMPFTSDGTLKIELNKKVA